MSARFICPHCHSPIDPQTMEAACSTTVHYRICPECDEAIVLAKSKPLAEASPAPAVDVLRPARVAADGTR